MRITFRLIISIIIAVTLIAAASSYFNVQSERKRLESEIERRAWLIAEGLKESIGALINQKPPSKLNRIIEKISSDQRVVGIAVYDTSGETISVTKEISGILPPKLNIIFENTEGEIGKGSYEKISNYQTYLFASPIVDDGGEKIGTVVIFNDASYIGDYLERIWYRSFLRVLANALVISIIILFIIRWNVTGPISKLSGWMRDVRGGKTDRIMDMPKEDLFAPISKEFSNLAKSLALARAAAEEEARLREKAESVWTGERLKEHIHSKIDEKKLIIVSNREPYMHIRRGKQIECIEPASGLITALDPVLKASGGLWVAHGGGNADRDTVDKNDIIRVPPDNPLYDLKRVWLTTEEEEGYYYGFSNEGLWPLCHIAHARPVFKIDDWARYQEVNLKFARAIDEEIDSEPFIFIQDYHFSILPRLLKERHPDARIALFWHIPWPNPEAFGICPWKREIIHGMLGADIIGFHTQFHCNNFLETVDRTLECQTDWEHFSTTKMGHTTFVKPFPISVDFTSPLFDKELPTKEELLKNLGIKASFVGIGVDRIDYTKGIPERFRAIERFFEKYSEYLGIFTFVQIGAPSREHIKRYHDLIGEVEAEADRINWKFQAKGWKPIVFIKRHLSHAEIEPYYKRADVCIVNSLHDGMNLVAKEFVTARDDEHGALILSTFTGASRELKDALLVNPYDIEQTADMIKAGIEMDPEDQKLRMIRMRNVVRENNVYKWAADIVTNLTQIRIE